MTNDPGANDRGGTRSPDPPSGQPPDPGYPPGYGSPPPGYPPTGYYPPPPLNYGTPGYGTPGYAGYPSGWGAPAGPPALKPGVIPLRPLTLSDIFNGAVTYIRANPKATLGLTALVVVATQVLATILQVWALTATDSGAAVTGSDIAGVASGIANGLALILLSGMLTVVIGRAVFGAGITIGEAWQRLRGRLLALIVFTVLEAIGILAIIIAVVVVIAVIAATVGGAPAALFGAPLVLVTIALLIYLVTMLSFAPALIVLERLGVIPAIVRSFTLIKNSFWRVFGIRLLATVVASVVALAVAVPFWLIGAILLAGSETTTLAVLVIGLAAIGRAVGDIITTPFNAGVVVLLYTDRRIRAEAFDLVLQTGATAGPAPADSTDELWLTQRQ